MSEKNVVYVRRELIDISTYLKKDFKIVW